jgi:hypothetical protein
MSQRNAENGEISGPGAERCATRGFHEFAMGLVGCRVCGAPGPDDDNPLIVSPFARGTTHTAEACARKFDETLAAVRRERNSDRDHGDEDDGDRYACGPVTFGEWRTMPAPKPTIACVTLNYDPRAMRDAIDQGVLAKMRENPAAVRAVMLHAVTGGESMVATFRMAPGELVHVGQSISVGGQTERARIHLPWYRRLWSWLTRRAR